MLQQMTAERRHHNLSFLDSLSAGVSDKKEGRKILNYLSEDYAAAIRIAGNLSSHAKWIPYPFLVNRLKKIADEMRAQAEIIRVKVAELGGAVPQANVDIREDVEFRQNVRRLVKDMEEHAAMSEAFIHQRNNIRDEGVIKLIDSISLEMQKQKEELLDIVMRLS
jgi:hypothetical protein